MKKMKSKRTKGKEEARPFEGLSKVNQNAAGVDIGATEIVACVPDGEEVQLVKAFGNYTVDLQAICEWFRKYKIKTAAMESTGVYWIPLFACTVPQALVRNWSGRDLNACSLVRVRCGK